MKHRHFVTGSAILLGIWLAFTFFHEVPSQRYPKLDKLRKTASAGKTKAQPDRMALGNKPELFHVSVSH